MIIFETKDFTVDAPDKPLHSRDNGGHIIIRPKQHYSDHFDLPLGIAADLMHLSMLVGEGVTIALRKRGLDVARINYQENGNWAHKPEWNSKPNVHLHMFIRTTHEKHPDNDSRFQPFPDALVFPPPDTDYYDRFAPLTEEDCSDIKSEILNLLQSDKYKTVGFEK